MKKLLKFLAFFFVVSAMAVCTTSCGDDDDKEEVIDNQKFTSIIVGKWMVDYYDLNYFVMKADGTGSSIETYDGVSETYPLTWSYQNNTLYIRFVDDPDSTLTLKVLSMSQNEIQIKGYYAPDDGDIDEADGHDEYGYFDYITFTRM